MCQLAISSSVHRQETEFHLFLTLGCVMFARLATAVSCHASHLKRNVREDLQYFRIYGNPFQPYTCPILFLVVHCASSPMILTDGDCGRPLLHGETNAQRTSKWTSASRKSSIGLVKGRLSFLFFPRSYILHRLLGNCRLKELGPHSLRKMVITLGGNGTPDFNTVGSSPFSFSHSLADPESVCSLV